MLYVITNILLKVVLNTNKTGHHVVTLNTHKTGIPDTLLKVSLNTNKTGHHVICYT